MQRDVRGKEGYLVVTTCKGMSLCDNEGDMVVATCKGMSFCGKEGDMVGATCKGCHFVIRRETDGHGHMQRDVTLW